jgi:hypothetical protein
MPGVLSVFSLLFLFNLQGGVLGLAIREKLYFLRVLKVQVRLYALTSKRSGHLFVAPGFGNPRLLRFHLNLL